MKKLIPLLTVSMVVCSCDKAPQEPDHPGATISSNDLLTPQTDVALSSHSNQIHSLRFSADGQRLVTASEDGAVRVWDAATGQPVPPRYKQENPDRMPILGPDNFQVLQDQIDALEKRIRELESKFNSANRQAEATTVPQSKP